ncbi:very short patch repair endonuclease [Bradyrhizobium valentinum]|uniref:Very short patch repair endonuclease n=1 Tax=Bradyrhizobium valentinum TaxID=1518501 RepID=A0A0R3L071_9BRAD|nr:DNA mismatch endonuclease Vsr [Bradyrhizobium valentinum]KRQ99308.1 endonuclease [Bradyrhizobium valentinum]
MDNLTPDRRSENMRRIKSTGMKPEMLVRRMVHGLGYRYRLHRKDLPGKPDLVFGPRRKVIFVHGCFWHGHERDGCLDARRPKSNTGYWNPKLTRNKERDAERIAALQANGWDVLVVWECETRNDKALRARLGQFLK